MARGIRARRRAREDDAGGLVIRKGRTYDPAWDLWRPVRRWPGILGTAVVVVAFALVVAYHYASAPSIKPPVLAAANGAKLQGPYVPPVAPNSGRIQSFAGHNGASQLAFRSTGQLMIWSFACNCGSNFGVLVHDAQGALVDVPVNSSGLTKSSATARYAKGSYTFDVIADGPWTIDLFDPIGLPDLSTPFSYFSAGQSVLGPFAGPVNKIEIAYLATVGTPMTASISDESLSPPTVFSFGSVSFSHRYKLTTLPKHYWILINTTGLWNVKVTP